MSKALESYTWISLEKIRDLYLAATTDEERIHHIESAISVWCGLRSFYLEKLALKK